MLLVELIDGATTHRISNEWLNLEHRWYPQVASLASLKVACAKIHGGYAKPVFGSLDLLPGLVSGLSYPLIIKLTETTELDAQVVFTGTAHRVSEQSASIKYDLYGVDKPKLVTNAVYTGTLVAVFTTAATTLGYTLDSSKARSPSPAVSYTATGDNELVDNLSDLAAFFCHGFTITGTVLQLFDMLSQTTTSTITEFEYFGAIYDDNKPISRIKAGTFGVDGGQAYGTAEDISPVCHTTQALIEAALANIKTLLLRRRVALTLPPDTLAPRVGQRINFTDTSLATTKATSLYVSGVVYDFDNHQFTVEGSAVTS